MSEIIGLVDQLNHECRRQCSGLIAYHRRWLPSNSILSEVDFGLCRTDNSFADTQKALLDDQLYSSSGSVTLSFLTAAGNDKGDWDLVDMLVGPSAGLEQRCKFLSTIECLIKLWDSQYPIVVLVSYNVLTEGRLARLPTKYFVAHMPISEWAEVECMAADIGPLEEHVQAADAEAFA